MKNTLTLIAYLLLVVVIIKFLPIWVLIIVGLGYIAYKYRNDIKAFFDK